MKKTIKLSLLALMLFSSTSSPNFSFDLKAKAVTYQRSEYDSDFMDWSRKATTGINSWKIGASGDTSLSADSDDPINRLNYSLTRDNKIHPSSNIDDLILSSASLLGTTDSLVANSTGDVYYAPLEDPSYYGFASDSIYLSAFYSYYNPSIYFDVSKDLESIMFYIKPFVGGTTNQSNTIQMFIDYYDLNGELPILTINDVDYISIKASGKGNGFTFVTDNYATLVNHIYVENDSGLRSPVIYFKIPFINSITSIRTLNINNSSDPASEETPDKTFYLKMHKSMSGSYRYYPFIIDSIDIVKNRLIINDFNSLNYFYNSEYSMTLHEMTLEHVTTTKVLSKGTSKTFRKTNEVKATFDSLETLENGFKAWNYSGFDLEAGMSGEINIKTITWSIDDETGIETSDYINTNVHKYSYNVDKSIRMYQYKWSGYVRSFNNVNKDDLFYNVFQVLSLGIYGAVAYDLGCYQLYGFSFYFDEAKTQPIENIKKMSIIYQCGYDRPNPLDSEGWYPNGTDSAKHKKIMTLDEVDASSMFLKTLCSSSRDKFIFTNDLPERVMTNDYGYKHDYVVCSYLDYSDINSYITKMAPLEISYEAEEGQLVKMSGNELGLHAVQDEDGIWRVYDAEGNYCPDYAVGFSEQDGTPFVGKADENGETTEEDAVNPGTGEELQTPPSFTDTLPDENKIDVNWFGITIIAILTITLIIIILNPGLLTALFTKKKKKKR